MERVVVLGQGGAGKLLTTVPVAGSSPFRTWTGRWPAGIIGGVRRHVGGRHAVEDFILRTGDMIQITIAPPAIVPMLMAPVPLVGSSTSVTVGGMPACLLGDELPKAISGPLPYTAPPFVTPGVGTVSVTLTPTNQTMMTQNGKAILIKGQQFIAKFTVSTPAMQPTPTGPVPDPVATKPGTAQFITTNINTQAG